MQQAQPQHEHLRAKPGLLGQREAEALVLINLGHGTKSAARAMGISPATVKAHLDRARKKLNARTVAQAVGMAWELGIITSKHLVLAALIVTSATSGMSDTGDLRTHGRITRTVRGGRRRETELAFLPPIIDPENTPAPLPTARQFFGALIGREAA